MTFNEILIEVNKFYSGKGYVWFRGQSNINYPLNSGLFRKKYTNINSYMNLERANYNLFKNMGHVYHNTSGINLLFIMQHFGLETRLIDWTESFATALFFATLDWDYEKNNACIWMINPLKFNESTLGYSVFKRVETIDYEELIHGDNLSELNKSYAIYPLRNNARLVAQQGAFLVQGNTMKPIDEEIKNTKILKCLKITKDMKNDIDNYLKSSGINYFTIFPDLGGLAKYLKSKT